MNKISSKTAEKKLLIIIALVVIVFLCFGNLSENQLVTDLYNKLEPYQPGEKFAHTILAPTLAVLVFAGIVSVCRYIRKTFTDWKESWKNRV